MRCSGSLLVLVMGAMLWGGCLLKPNPAYRDLAGADDLAGVPPDLAGVPPDLPEVLVPGGTFQMGTAPDGGGSSDEQPEYLVTLGDYYLGTYEVTVEAYGRCVAVGRCMALRIGDSCNGLDRPEHPVNCVTWVDASAFCEWLGQGRRLPTEEEWEYAARGATKAEYPWGRVPPPDDQLCWSGKMTRSGTCPVGSYPPTLKEIFDDNGVHDLAGNVWEWTGSEHASYPTKKSCSVMSSTCVLRGGSWYGDQPGYVRAAYRGSYGPPMSWDGNVGFRCARPK